MQVLTNVVTKVLTVAFCVGSPITAFAAETKAPTAEKKTSAIIKLEVKEVDGKKIWSPASSTVKVNEPVTVEAHNTLAAPHGLTIEGYVPGAVVGAGETKKFTFTPSKKGDLKVHCQLHPAHVDGVIKVQ